MIQIQDVSKHFDEIKAVDHLTLDIPEKEVFGLVGTNGAGKSTLLRMIAGILRADEGQLLIDGENVYENEARKADVFYISDEAYLFPNATSLEMMDYYRCMYTGFDTNKFHALMKQFGLDEKRRVSTFSKGMRKQLLVILGLCTGTKYLLCDETFDGLDPVMRQAVKSMIANEILSRDFTPVIASHNLRELEDLCDRVGLLHQGGMLLARDLEDMRQQIHKVQCVIRDPEKEKALLSKLEVLTSCHQGALLVFTARGLREEINASVHEAEPVYSEIVPLSLEEIFISETEVAGYEIKHIIA